MFVPGGTGKGATAQTTPYLKSACEAAFLTGASWLEAGERKGFNPGNPLCMYVCMYPPRATSRAAELDAPGFWLPRTAPLWCTP